MVVELQWVPFCAGMPSAFSPAAIASEPLPDSVSALKLYQELEEESFAELRDSEVTAPNILTKLLRLSQVTGGHLTDDEKDTHMVSTAKLDALSDIVDTAVSENKKLVVMARFVPELNDIQALLEKKKIGYAVVRGGVKDRAEEVRRFQNDDDCRVFIGQIAAAGLGITLTAASTMVFYSLDYSMSNFDQAKARIHRVGQRENCHYIYLIARGTVDRKILRSLRDKIDLGVFFGEVIERVNGYDCLVCHFIFLLNYGSSQASRPLRQRPAE